MAVKNGATKVEVNPKISFGDFDEIRIVRVSDPDNNPKDKKSYQFQTFSVLGRVYESALKFDDVTLATGFPYEAMAERWLTRAEAQWLHAHLRESSAPSE